MPHFEKSLDTGFGVTLPAAAIDVVSFSARKGEATMAVYYETYADAAALDPANPVVPIPGKSFNNTVPLNGHAVELLTTLLTIIAEAAASETPPSGLEGVTFVP